MDGYPEKRMDVLMFVNGGKLFPPRFDVKP